MARPIKEIPVLYGKDAENLKWHMDHPKHISKEERQRMNEAYEHFKSIADFPMP